MIPKICAVAILSVILYAALDSFGFKSKGLFAALCALMILSALGDSLSSLLSSVLLVGERTGISEAAICALRAVGLGYVFGFTADICASLGEELVAKAVTLVGRVQIFMVAYPYFEKIVALGMELLQ